VPTILLDENLDGYAAYLWRWLSEPGRGDVTAMLDVRIATFDEVGLLKGIADDQLWTFCQAQQYYLITDNRSEDKPDSLEATIRTQNLPTSLPVFTISSIDRFRTERAYVVALVDKLLELVFDADNIRGTGRQYLP
jgi:hypothetical protein